MGRKSFFIDKKMTNVITQMTLVKIFLLWSKTCFISGIIMKCTYSFMEQDGNNRVLFFVYIFPPYDSSILISSLAFSIIAKENIMTKKLIKEIVTPNQFSSNALNIVYITFIAAKKKRRVEVRDNSIS